LKKLFILSLAFMLAGCSHSGVYTEGDKYHEQLAKLMRGYYHQDFKYVREVSENSDGIAIVEFEPVNFSGYTALGAFYKTNKDRDGIDHEFNFRGAIQLREYPALLKKYLNKDVDMEKALRDYWATDFYRVEFFDFIKTTDYVVDIDPSKMKEASVAIAHILSDLHDAPILDRWSQNELSDLPLRFTDRPDEIFKLSEEVFWHTEASFDLDILKNLENRREFLK